MLIRISKNLQHKTRLHKQNLDLGKIDTRMDFSEKKEIIAETILKSQCRTKLSWDERWILLNKATYYFSKDGELVYR